MLHAIKIKLSFRKEMGFLLLAACLLYFFPPNKFYDSSPHKNALLSREEGGSDCWQ